jgi:SAM-dependent methyltransferase
MLPVSSSAFAEKQYWAQFFADRGGKTFEWYGEWVDVQANVVAAIANKAAARLLLPGCGNSRLSLDLFDAGYTSVTSIDLDAGVIREMKQKAGAARPGMVWQVQDATGTSFAAAAFTAVVDKGTLDALLPENLEAHQATAVRYVRECARVLAPGGALLLVSLLQPHVLAALLSCAASDARWAACDIHTFASSDLSSPLCPFFVVLRRAFGKGAPMPVCVHEPARFEKRVQGAPARTTLPQSSIVHIQVPAEPTRGSADFAAVLRAVDGLRWAYALARQLSSVGNSTYLSFDLWAQTGGDGTIFSVTAAGEAAPRERAAPRFTVTVLDAGPALPGSAPTAAVLLVPLGREHEYAFGARGGQMALARQVSVARLLVVTLGRDWQWSGVTPAAVQAQLNPVVATMVPPECLSRNGGANVPYLAVAQDLGSLTVVATGDSKSSGGYRVEEVADEEEEEEEVDDDVMPELTNPDARRVLRRLIFFSNRAAIQTEVPVAYQPSAPPTFDFSRLAFPYHRGMVACLALLHEAWVQKEAPTERGVKEAPPRLPIAVLGLGGGALASFLASTCPWAAVTALELDAEVVDIAVQHFGLRITADTEAGPGPAHSCVCLASLDSVALAALMHPSRAPAPGTVRVIVGDALDFVRRLAELRDGTVLPTVTLAALVVDVDAKAKDMKAGLSFPPVPFVSKAWLGAAARVLAPSTTAASGPGALLINLGARAKALYGAAVGAVSREFTAGATATLPTGGEEDADLNAVVLALTLPKDGAATGASLAAAALKAAAADSRVSVSDAVARATLEWLPGIVWTA